MGLDRAAAVLAFSVYLLVPGVARAPGVRARPAIDLFAIEALLAETPFRPGSPDAALPPRRTRPSAATPEPGCAALVALGLGGLACRRHPTG